jgi:DNA-binding SARP family transcriptional activator
MLLKDVRTFLKNVDSALLEFKYHLARAHAALTVDEDGAHANELRKAFAIGRSRKIYHFDWWLPAIMQRLCAVALEQDIEAPYVRELIRRNELLPEANRPIPLSWPWPVKIFMLGRFGIELDGKAVIFGGKTPKKPLELLKAIIALGGRDVSEERIIDALWPEAPGDLACKSFEMALQRLRKLIGSDKAIRRHDGLLTLDNAHCWTDVWAFEKILNDAGAGRREDREKRVLLEKAISLYKGHFLPADARQPWSALARERLRSKYLRLVTKAGEQHERQGEWKKAVECFERGLERDAVCEEFYQRLMICHNKLGHRTEAVKTYQRCRAALLDGLGLEPSSKTEEMHSSLLHNR